MPIYQAFPAEAWLSSGQHETPMHSQNNPTLIKLCPQSSHFCMKTQRKYQKKSTKDTQVSGSDLNLHAEIQSKLLLLKELTNCTHIA